MANQLNNTQISWRHYFQRKDLPFVVSLFNKSYVCVNFNINFHHDYNQNYYFLKKLASEYYIWNFVKHKARLANILKNDFVNEFEERDILGFSQLEVQEVSEKKLKAKNAMKL